MFGWFSTSTPVYEDYAFLEVDFHAHWLPGIDDGAPDMAHTLDMLRRYEALGFRKLVASPHVMVDMYQNTPTIINSKLDEVRRAATEAGIGLELEAAAEYLLDEGFEKHIDHYGLLPIFDKYVLIEFGFYSPPLNLEQTLFQVQTAGYRPIIAHPERYAYYHGKENLLKRLRDKGILFQVNLLSLIGHYGGPVQRAAIALIDGGIVHYLGTDAHSTDHLDKLKPLLRDRKAGKVLDGNDFLNSEMISA